MQTQGYCHNNYFGIASTKIHSTQRIRGKAFAPNTTTNEADLYIMLSWTKRRKKMLTKNVNGSLKSEATSILDNILELMDHEGGKLPEGWINTVRDILFEFPHDYDILTKAFHALKDHCCHHKFASLAVFHMSDDKKLMMKLIESDPSVFSYVSRRLQQDSELVLHTLQSHHSQKENSTNIPWPSSTMGCYDEFVKSVVILTNGNALRYATESLQNDEDFVFEAVAEAMKYGGQ